MPAYDYRCVECSTVCEITRPARDDSPIACPECGAATKQVFHPVGVHFKGGGFYNNDSRPAPAAPSAPVAPPCSTGGG